MQVCSLAIALIVSVSLSGLVVADDWSQWLGNERDSHWNETGIVDTLPEKPNVLWRMPVEIGYSGPAVVANRVYVADYRVTSGNAKQPNPGKRDELEGFERIHCLDAETGKEIWKYEYPCNYKISYAMGPRCTPTIDDGHVYFLGAEGHLVCITTESGKEVWKKDLKTEYKLKESPMWGFAAHPLVVGDKLFCLVGGEGTVAVAFDKKTGKEIWRSLSAKSQGYCPPTMINAGGVDQLLIWHAESLNSLNPETGEKYWSFPMKPAYDMSIIAPIKHGDYLLATALQNESILLKLDKEKPAATIVWEDKGIHPDHNPPVLVDGHIYGVDVKGRLRCIKLESGERVWESLATTPGGRPQSSATGFVIKNGDKYFLTNETGDLILAKMSPKGYEEIGRMKMLEATSSSFGRKVVWSHPAFANKCVFARNDKEIVCISLAKQ